MTFMLVLVPEPVWKTSIGNWSSCRPSTISAAAATIASRCSAVIDVEVGVGAGGGGLDPGEGVDQRGRQRPAADREVLDRALGLRPPQRVGRAPRRRPWSRARCGSRRSCAGGSCRRRYRAVIAGGRRRASSARRGPGGGRRGRCSSTSPKTERRSSRAARRALGRPDDEGAAGRQPVEDGAQERLVVERGVGLVDELAGAVVDVEQHHVVRRGRRPRRPRGRRRRRRPGPGCRRAAGGRGGSCRRASTRPAPARSRPRRTCSTRRSPRTRSRVKPRPEPADQHPPRLVDHGERGVREGAARRRARRCPSRRRRWPGARVRSAPPLLRPVGARAARARRARSRSALPRRTPRLYRRRPDDLLGAGTWCADLKWSKTVDNERRGCGAETRRGPHAGRPTDAPRGRDRRRRLRQPDRAAPRPRRPPPRHAARRRPGRPRACTAPGARRSGRPTRSTCSTSPPAA